VAVLVRKSWRPTTLVVSGVDRHTAEDFVGARVCLSPAIDNYLTATLPAPR
jgi:hypothetical protein